MAVELRRAKNVDDYARVESIQRVIWGLSGEPPVPVPILVAMNNNGGLVEIAEEDGRIIGFSLAFPGREGDNKFLYSHMAGVMEEYRNMSIGYQIKMHQFEVAKNMGYNEVRWTFDMMKARNSYFNVHKLKAFAFDFKINYYGIMGSKENAGVESDRIEAHKFLYKNPITDLNFEYAGKITDFPNPWDDVAIGNERLGIEIPWEIDNSDHGLAGRWRLKLRDATLKLEKNNYVMTDVTRNKKVVTLIFSKREKSGL